MTAISLLNIFSFPRSAAGLNHEDQSNRLAVLGSELIDAAIADLERLKHYERTFSSQSSDDAEVTLALVRSIWGLYEQWAAEADHLVRRRRSLEAAGCPMTGLNRLDDAMGLVRARVQLTPEQIVRAETQARRGEFVSATELRDELHARLRS